MYNQSIKIKYQKDVVELVLKKLKVKTVEELVNRTIEKELK